MAARRLPRFGEPVRDPIEALAEGKAPPLAPELALQRLNDGVRHRLTARFAQLPRQRHGARIANVKGQGKAPTAEDVLAY
jgi:hypothetical protein